MIGQGIQGGRTALYRHFDAAGSLLYVGISLSAVQRLAQHKSTSAWFSQIARVDVEWLDTREAALAAEAAAIVAENPRCNRARPIPAPAKLEHGYVGKGKRFAVMHRRTGRVDGWYTDGVDALGALDFFRQQFPNDEFELYPCEPAFCFFICQDRVLRPDGSNLWSAAA